MGRPLGVPVRAIGCNEHTGNCMEVYNENNINNYIVKHGIVQLTLGYWKLKNISIIIWIDALIIA